MPAAASVPFVSLGIGLHSITAVYAGDPNFLTTSSNTLNQLVNQAPSNVTLLASQSGGAGSPVAFTAVVTGLAPVTPTGSVNIATQGAPATTIASCVLAGSATHASCTASATVAVGTTAFVANYSGDTNYTGATGNSSSIAVQSVRGRSR